LKVKPKPELKTTVRLNKYLSECGITSRRKSEEFITNGRISINNIPVRDLAQRVNPLIDRVELDGERLFPRKKEYFVLNKPAGYITTTSDERNRRKVTDLIKTDSRIFPVGRLDYNTTGVLLLTNDGDFSNFLTHPSHSIPRVYEVQLDKPLPREDMVKLLKGIYLDGRKSRFEDITGSFGKSGRIFSVSTTEGRNHFVKRMFAQLGYYVKKLHRQSFAGISVKGIPEGKYKKLTTTEIKNIYGHFQNV